MYINAYFLMLVNVRMYVYNCTEAGIDVRVCVVYPQAAPFINCMCSTYIHSVCTVQYNVWKYEYSC